MQSNKIVYLRVPLRLDLILLLLLLSLMLKKRRRRIGFPNELICANRVFKSESYPPPLEKCDDRTPLGVHRIYNRPFKCKRSRFLSAPVAMIVAIVNKRGLLRLILPVSIPSRGGG